MISELQLQSRNRICVAFQMFLNYNSLSFQSEQPIGRNVEGCHLAISGKPHIPAPVMWKYCIISPWFARLFSILYPKSASDPSRSRLMIGFYLVRFHSDSGLRFTMFYYCLQFQTISICPNSNPWNPTEIFILLFLCPLTQKPLHLLHNRLF